MRALVALALGLAAAACAQVDSPTPQAVMPADYKMSYVVARECRSSVDHDLAYVVVRARADLTAAYDSGPYPLPAGTLLVKEQYQDARCNQLTGYTAMRKETSGAWTWFRLDREGTPLEQGKLSRCIRCHDMCKARDYTCAEASP